MIRQRPISISDVIASAVKGEALPQTSGQAGR